MKDFKKKEVGLALFFALTYAQAARALIVCCCAAVRCAVAPNAGARKHLTIVQTREHPPYFYLGLPDSQKEWRITPVSLLSPSSSLPSVE